MKLIDGCLKISLLTMELDYVLGQIVDFVKMIEVQEQTYS